MMRNRRKQNEMKPHNELADIKKISKKQKEIYELSERDNFLEVLSGSIRIGKSFWGIGGWIKWVIDEFIYLNSTGTHAVLAYNSRLVKLNLFKYIKFWLWYYGVPHEQVGYTIYLTLCNEVVEIHGFGANNEASFSSFQGATFKSVFIDEGALMPINALNVAVDRVLTYRVKGRAKVVITSNPEGGELHPFYQKYIMKYHTIHCNLLDNPIYTDEDVERYRETLTEADFNRRIMGLWVTSEGAVYQKLPKEISKEDLPEFEYITIGVDEGRVDDYAGIPIGRGYDGRYYVFGEFSDDYSSLPVKVQNFKEFAEEVAEDYDVEVDIIGETNPGITVNILQDDISLDERIEAQYVKKSIKNSEWKGKSSIQERVDIVNYMINLGLIVFVEGACPKLKASMANAVYKNGVRSDTEKDVIDYLDAMEYGLSTELEDIWNDIKDYLETGAIGGEG